MLLISFSLLLTVVLSVEYASPIKEAIKVESTDAEYLSKPFVQGAKTFYGGIISEWTGKIERVTSPIIDATTNSRTIIGELAQMGSEDVLKVVESAKVAWKNGQGVWPQMSPEERMAALQNVVSALKDRRDEIVKVLMWEICKTSADAAAEFDRTMTFIEATIDTFRRTDTFHGAWKVVGGILSKVRRAAIGIMMCLGPFNYPFNETYATLIPALLAGNIVIMKVPNTGGLAHILTMEAYAKNLPPGTINFYSGSGRETVAPMMATGAIDVLAFIGGSSAADVSLLYRLNIYVLSYSFDIHVDAANHQGTSVSAPLEDFPAARRQESRNCHARCRRGHCR